MQGTELSSNAVEHLLFEDFVSKDYKKLEETMNANKTTGQQKSDETFKNQINYVLSNYFLNRNVNNFFIKLDKKLNKLDETLEEDTTNWLNNNKNLYPLMYNYATISKASNRFNTIFNILNKGFNSTDAYDNEYSKIKLSVMLFELSFYYQNFEGTSPLLNYMMKFHKSVEAKANNKEIKKLPLYNSILYGAETYHYSTQVEFNYNKSELDILLCFIKIFYLILMEDRKLSVDYLQLATKLKNNFVKDITLYNSKDNRTYPTDEGEDKIVEKPSGYSEMLGSKICSHIKMLIQFLYATSGFYEKDFVSCIQYLSAKIPSKDKKTPPKKISSGKYKFFYLNSLGCCHFQMDKPTLAIQFFAKALQECENVINNNQKTTKPATKKETKNNKDSEKEKEAENIKENNTKSFYEVYKQNAASKLPMIIYNIALSFYKKENYEEAIRNFQQIGSTQSTNFWYWYRLGVCYYKIYLKKITDNYQNCTNDLYSCSKEFDFPNPTTKEDKNDRERANSMQQQSQPLNPQALNQVNFNDGKSSKKSPIEHDYEFAKHKKFKRYFLPSNKSNWSEEDKIMLNRHLQNAYNAFYNAF